jgi:hypothetical protein
MSIGAGRETSHNIVIVGIAGSRINQKFDFTNRVAATCQSADSVI